MTTDEAKILLCQMYLPQFDEEEKQALTMAIQALEEVNSYRDAEKQGLLVKLSCNIGDTLYQPRKDHIIEYKVIGLIFDITSDDWVLEVATQVGLKWIKTTCPIKLIGKTVFLTKEEADEISENKS